MSENGAPDVSLCKVVVVDEKDDEASGLMRALSKRNIPVLYYTGREDELPNQPLLGVRLIFLDMLLEGMQGQSDRAITTTLMSLIRKLISTNNGPFLIFAWTTHDELLETFKAELEKSGSDFPKPFSIVNMEKSECKVGDEFNYEKISKKLDDKLSELKIFDFFMKWEEIVDNSKSNVVGLINSLVPQVEVESWRVESNRLLYQLAIAHSGISVKNGAVSPTQSSMKVLNSILNDNIEKKVDSCDHLLEKPDNLIIPDINKAIINSKINIRDIRGLDAKVSPGNLYLLNDFELLGKYVNFLPENISSFQKEYLAIPPDLEPKHRINVALSQCIYCLLEISPVCDYNQGKWRSSRLLAGIIVPASLIEQKKQNAGFLYWTPLLIHDGSLYYLILNSHYNIVQPFDVINGLKPQYQLRMDLLTDIQNKFSGHISRHGVMYL